MYAIGELNEIFKKRLLPVLPIVTDGFISFWKVVSNDDDARLITYGFNYGVKSSTTPYRKIASLKARKAMVEYVSDDGVIRDVSMSPKYNAVLNLIERFETATSVSIPQS